MNSRGNIRNRGDPVRRIFFRVLHDFFGLLSAVLYRCLLRSSYSLTPTAFGSWVVIQAYDRLVTPKKLVVDGPYRLCQHPIYTSYMLLFSSFCILFHSPALALALLSICGVYFNYRASLEENILLTEFGGAYIEYRTRTKRFFPFIL